MAMILYPKKRKKKSDKISKVETFCYDGFPGKLSECFCFALKPCFQQNLPMFNSNPLKKLKKRKACKSKRTVCFTIEQNILVDLKQVLEGEFFILFFILMSASLFFVNVSKVSYYPCGKMGCRGLLKPHASALGWLLKSYSP